MSELYDGHGDYPRDGDAATSGRAYDPVTFSVILNRFNTIVQEMTLTMERSAYTPILALCRDYSCAIYDAVPRQIAMVDAIPIHTTSMHLILEEIAEAFSGDLHDGDIFLCNHPFRANTHVGDLVTAVPVFVRDVHLFWAATKGHQQDCGAFLPSSVAISAQNIWQEGLHIPPVKLFDRGRERRDLVDLYLSNVRYPDLLYGDLLAQLASIERGRSRLVELAEEFEPAEALRYIEVIIDYADRRMAEEIRLIPDGEYFAETWIDSDAATELDIPLIAKVTIADDQVYVDYTGTCSQSPVGQNGSYACLQAASAIPFLNYIDSDIPHNHGCIQHLRASAPEGTICNPLPPASTTTATITPSNQIQDVINRAMVHAVPDRIPAGGARTNNMPDFAGVDERDGKAWGVVVFNNMGGQGAANGVDGWPMWGTPGSAGALKAVSIEQLELLHPLFVEEMEVEEDSMGFGQWIGGPGNRVVIRPTAGPMKCTGWGDGYRNPPYGVLGGTPGIGGGQYVESRKTGRRRFISATGYFAIDRDEIWVGVSTGGGGYGNPLARNPDQVRRDVRDGLISREAARDFFGVVITDGFDPQIDSDATERLRAELAALERPLLDPTSPGASTWLEAIIREDDEYVLNPLDW